MNIFIQQHLEIYFHQKKLNIKSKNHIENLSIFLGEKIKLINFNCNKFQRI